MPCTISCRSCAPGLCTGAVWFQLEADGGGSAELVIACPATDGELWMMAPAAEAA